MQGLAGEPSDVPRDAFFTRIVQQHSRLLYRVAYSVLRNPEDAEDAVADALLKLLRGNAWREITNERAFLSRAVWRTALDRLQARPPRGDGDGEALLLDDQGPTPEDRAAAANERMLLQTWIDRLPLELREPLLLSAIQELNSPEIAELLQVPEGTVRTRLMRARGMLREQYEALEGKARDREVAAKGD